MTANFQKPVRKSLPILACRGTYYEVGFEIGRTFGDKIRRWATSTQKDIESSPNYDQEFADNVFANSAKIVQSKFPQFWEELYGMADGAGMDFRQLFDLHLVDVLTHDFSHRRPMPSAIAEVDEQEEESGDRTPTGSQLKWEERRGCSDILLNIGDLVAIGHTEDLDCELVDECYVTRVHYKDNSPHPRGKLKMTEEHISAYLYPGDLPGYAMATSEYFAVTVNTVSSAEVDPWGTPKGVLARAAMACRTIEEMVTMLEDHGHGIASGLSMNVISLKDNPRRVFNIEAGCRVDAVVDEMRRSASNSALVNISGDDEFAAAAADDVAPTRMSRVSVHEVLPGEVYYHCNTYRRVDIAPIYSRIMSTEHRLATLESFPKPSTLEDMKRMLSDESHKDFPLFRDRGIKDWAKTGAIGIFDGKEGTWTIYTDRATEDDTLAIKLPIEGGLK